MSKNLLLEIGTEEMPANIMSGIVEQMHALAGAKLNEARIAFEKVDVYATPRRLAVIVTAAADAQPDEEVKNAGLLSVPRMMKRKCNKSCRGVCPGTGDFRG